MHIPMWCLWGLDIVPVWISEPDCGGQSGVIAYPLDAETGAEMTTAMKEFAEKQAEERKENLIRARRIYDPECHDQGRW